MSKSRDAFRSNESWERWNTHQTKMVEQEVFGTVLRFVQDPSSEHLGTTVWDASVVLAKWFEKNIRKGEFSRAKVRGKRAIELGAGMGLAGMAFAMVGADVALTDTADVLGLLRINYENNLSPSAVRLARAHQHGTWADSAGGVVVAELDWTKPEQVHAPPLKPPYDFVLAADCIYHEVLTEHFHRTVMDVTNEKSTVVVCNELRSHSVQDRFMELFSATHSMKAVPHSKMDDTYQHPNIFIYIMKKKKHLCAARADGDGEAGAASGTTGSEGALVTAASADADAASLVKEKEQETAEEEQGAGPRTDPPASLSPQQRQDTGQDPEQETGQERGHTAALQPGVLTESEVAGSGDGRPEVPEMSGRKAAMPEASSAPAVPEGPASTLPEAQPGPSMDAGCSESAAGEAAGGAVLSEPSGQGCGSRTEVVGPGGAAVSSPSSVSAAIIATT